MNIFKLKRTLSVILNDNDSLDLIKFKYSKLLNLFNFRTDYEYYGISFKRKIKTIYSSGENRYDSLRIFREGALYLSVNHRKLKITWSVKLDFLYFISFLLSISTGFFFLAIINLTILVSIISGIIGFIIYMMIGILIITDKIVEIDKTVLNNSEY